MAFIKLLFVMMILVPVAVVMLVLMNRLLNDFSESVKNENRESPEDRVRRKGRKPESYGSERYYGAQHTRRNDTYDRRGVPGSTMEGNPSYEAYRKARSRQEEKANERSAYMHYGEPEKRRHVNNKTKRSGKSEHRKSRKLHKKDREFR